MIALIINLSALNYSFNKATKNKRKHKRSNHLFQPDPKKCAAWYVTAAKGDYQELAKLASEDTRLVKLKVGVDFSLIIKKFKYIYLQMFYYPTYIEH